MNPTNPTHQSPEPTHECPCLARNPAPCSCRLEALIESIQIPEEVTARIYALGDEALYLAASHIGPERLLEIFPYLPLNLQIKALASTAQVVDHPERFPLLAAFVREQVPELDRLVESLLPQRVRKDAQS